MKRSKEAPTKSGPTGFVSSSVRLVLRSPLDRSRKRPNAPTLKGLSDEHQQRCLFSSRDEPDTARLSTCCTFPHLGKVSSFGGAIHVGAAIAVGIRNAGAILAGRARRLTDQDLAPVVQLETSLAGHHVGHRTGASKGRDADRWRRERSMDTVAPAARLGRAAPQSVPAPIARFPVTMTSHIFSADTCSRRHDRPSRPLR